MAKYDSTSELNEIKTIAERMLDNTSVAIQTGETISYFTTGKYSSDADTLAKKILELDRHLGRAGSIPKQWSEFQVNLKRDVYKAGEVIVGTKILP